LIVSYETVKYFNADAHEFDRHRKAVEKYQSAEYKVLFSLNMIKTTRLP
jgi:ABC-type transport system involved in Fe-S cluster assembly fused permease/ATPase subunit